MARTSKFSFPLPGRRSNTTKVSNVDEQVSQNMEENDQIANGKPTKAQRLLGTSDFGRIDSKQKRPKITRALRAKPSFMSISVSELSQNLAMSGDGIHDHADAAGRPRTPCRSPRGICPRPSSPLLGQHYHYTSAVTNNRTDLLHSGLRESRSSSTLRSYYDPIKSPLSVSQQTSASSARDMALRKGCTTIAKSPDHCRSETALTPAVGPKSHMQTYGDEGPRKRPPRLDFSKLFTRPQTSHGVLLSPHRVTKSPSSLSMASDMSPSTPLYRKESCLGNNRSNDSVSRSDQSSPYFAAPVEPTFRPKVNVRKPKQGIQNWFDGMEEGDDLDDPADDSKPSEVVTKSMDCPPAMQACSGTLALSDRKSALSHSSQLTLTGQNLSSPQPSPQYFRTNDIQLCLSLRSCEATSIHSPSSPKSRSSKKSSGSIFTNSDLQNQSVLALSSSEDEDEMRASMGNRKHRLRKGATSTNENDNVIIDRSQTVPIIRPVTTLKRSGSILSSRSRSSATSVRYGIFPDSNRSNTTTFLTPPSTSHSRHQRPSGQWTAERRSEDPRPKSSNAATSGSPNFLMGSASQPASPSRSESGLQTRKSRIMAVTREEESLLEAMRHKRAIMRQGKSDQAYSPAAQEDAPKSAIVNARAHMAVSRKEVKFLEEPLPPISPVSALSIAVSNQLVSSTGSAFLDDVSTSSASLSHGARPMSYLSVPSFSPNIHFTPSDYQSSTPTSRASPKTPPSGHARSETFIDGTGIVLSLAADEVPADTEMERCKKRIAGSDVVELDTMEEKSMVRDEQNDIVLWTMDR